MIYRFNDCELDTGGHELRRDGNVCAVEPRVFGLLAYLVENRDRMIGKDELFENLWDGRIVSDSALSSQIKAARRAIGDDGTAQNLIRTVHGKGFRFVGAVSENGGHDLPANPAPTVERRAHGTGERPSIAILPFDNLSGDPDQEFFSDGITEDIITALSKYRSFFVTARNSTFSFKGKTPSIRQVAEEFGVRYVMEGSVRRAGGRVRISCQLSDAQSGIQLWAERYDREVNDIFAVQDEITEAIVGAVAPEIGNAEETRATKVPTDDLDAWDLHQRGMWHLWRYTRDDGAKAVKYFEQALERDPQLSSAYAGLSLSLSHHALMGWSKSAREPLEKARHFAELAVKGDTRDAFAHYCLGRVLTLFGEHEAALSELNIARDLNPNFALTHFGLGFTLIWIGRTSDGIPMIERAIRQSPNDPIRWSFEMMMGTALWREGRYEEAKDVLVRSRGQMNADFWPSAAAAVNYISMGDKAAAADAVAEILRKRPELTVATIGSMALSSLPDYREAFLKNLAEAGMPLE